MRGAASNTGPAGPAAATEPGKEMKPASCTSKSICRDILKGEYTAPSLIPHNVLQQVKQPRSRPTGPALLLAHPTGAPPSTLRTARLCLMPLLGLRLMQELWPAEPFPQPMRTSSSLRLPVALSTNLSKVLCFWQPTYMPSVSPPASCAAACCACKPSSSPCPHSRPSKCIEHSPAVHNVEGGAPVGGASNSAGPVGRERGYLTR